MASRTARLDAGPLDGGMTKLQALIASAVFAFLAATTTIGRLAYNLFVLDRADEKMGAPTDQFQTMAGVHVLATAAAAVAFGLVLLLVRRRQMKARAAIVASTFFGVLAGCFSVLTIAETLEFLVPLRGIAEDFVSVILVGTVIGFVVRALSGGLATRPAV